MMEASWASIRFWGFCGAVVVVAVWKRESGQGLDLRSGFGFS